MKMFFGTMQQAIFIKRDNRFRAEVEIDGQRIKAHLPNTGRMLELLTAGAQIWVRKAVDIENRKTLYDLLLVEYQGQMICLDAQLTNKIFGFWLRQGLVPEFADATAIRREQKWGTSRFDFLLTRAERPYFIEVKSVNLVVDGIARFPDAPTTRGVKHVRELTAYQQAGGGAAVVFIVMGNQVTSFAPNTAADPDFAKALAEAVAAGVEIYVYRALVDCDGVDYGGRILFEPNSLESREKEA